MGMILKFVDLSFCGCKWDIWFKKSGGDSIMGGEGLVREHVS
jgi:hypothetical protein